MTHMVKLEMSDTSEPQAIFAGSVVLKTWLIESGLSHKCRKKPHRSVSVIISDKQKDSSM